MLFPLPMGFITPSPSSDRCGNQGQMAVPREANGKRGETFASLKGGGGGVRLDTKLTKRDTSLPGICIIEGLAPLIS